MATYEELNSLATNQSLIRKVTMAIAISAEEIRVEDPPVPARQQWAIRALINPDGEARKIMWLLMAQNKTLTTVQIEAASDASIQTAVDNAVALFTSI